jgi:hypothetical protein
VNLAIVLRLHLQALSLITQASVLAALVVIMAKLPMGNQTHT